MAEKKSFEKWIKPCMIWHHKWIGIGLILLSIWWFLYNMNIIPKSIFGPVIVIIAGIICLFENSNLWRRL